MNDTRVAEELWLTYADSVLAYARRRVGRADAEDIVAEVFVVALRRPSAVPAHPLPWLYATARYVIANFRRRQERHLEAQRQLPIASEPDPDAIAGANLAAAAALTQLSTGEREALLLVTWEGLSSQEAARAAGCSRAALAVRLHRARTRFRRALLELPEEIQAQGGGSS